MRLKLYDILIALAVVVVLVPLFRESPVKADVGSSIKGTGGASSTATPAPTATPIPGTDTYVCFNDGGSPVCNNSKITFTKGTSTFYTNGLVAAGTGTANGFRWDSSTGMNIMRNNGRGSMVFSGDFGVGVPLFAIEYTGNISMVSGVSFGWVAGTSADAAPDTFLQRDSTQVIQFGADSATPTSYGLKGTDSRSGTDSNVAGGDVTFATGRGTGTGNGADFRIQTPVLTASGTGAQTLADRILIPDKYTTLTAASATAFMRCNVPTSTVASGRITYGVEANDGTDFQSTGGEATWRASNKAGTTTVALGTDSQAADAGLTCTLSIADSGSGNVDFKLNCTSTLVETVLRAQGYVTKNFGTGACSAQ